MAVGLHRRDGSASSLGAPCPPLPAPCPPGPLLRAPTALVSCLPSLFLPPSSRDDAHIRVKRYRHSMNSFAHSQAARAGCLFGTCTVQKLLHDIHTLTNKGKDDAAPVSKISPQGYGRRRRSLPERRGTARSPRAGRRTRTRRARPLAAVLGV